jgi:non-specific serine/threonine protein kinase
MLAATPRAGAMTTRRRTAPDLPAEAPPSHARKESTSNLPTTLSSFIGRDQEQQAVRLMLNRSRLVTLTGSGGVGKTRLALAVAEALRDAYPDGIWLLELAPVADPTLLPQALAHLFGLREEAGRTCLQVVTDFLRNRCLLLVLDNCEHLATSCAAMATALLRACPEIHLLATSREGLRVSGERTFRVPSLRTPDWPLPGFRLPAPDPGDGHEPGAGPGGPSAVQVAVSLPFRPPPAVDQATGGNLLPVTTAAAAPDPAMVGSYEAVQLFVMRAQDRRHDFALTSETAGAVAEICARLEGVPLAIELAAARVGSISVEAIAARLDDQLQLLTTGARDLPYRQRTLRAALDWSWELLAEQERILLRRLAVFAGGWTLEAAEAVCSDRGPDALPKSAAASAPDLPLAAVLDGLDGLVSKSLVQPDERNVGQQRYRLLEIVRQYAAERLDAAGEEAVVQDRRLAFVLALAAEAVPRLRGPAQAWWLDRLEAEHDNLRAALRWTLHQRGNWTSGVRLAEMLWHFWQVRGYISEGRGWLEVALKAGPETSSTVRGNVLYGDGVLARLQGAYEQAMARFEESLGVRRTLGDTQGIADVLNDLGIVASRCGDRERAATLYEEALRLHRTVGDLHGIADVLNNLGVAAYERGDFKQATALYEEALGLRRTLGDTHAIATSLSNLGNVASDCGDGERAVTLYEEALRLHRTVGDLHGIADVLNNLGVVAYNRGDFIRATALYEEALGLRRTLGDRHAIATSLSNLGVLAKEQDDYQRAAALYEEALGLRRAMGHKQGIATVLNNLGVLAKEQGHYARALALHAESLMLLRALGATPIIAVSLISQGDVARCLGDYTRAKALYEEALSLRRALGHKQGIATGLLALGLLLHEQGDDGQAAARLEESLRLSLDLGADRIGVDALEGLSWVDEACGHPGRAALLAAAAEAMRTGRGVPLKPAQRATHERAVEKMRAALGDTAFDAAWKQGQGLTWGEAVALALQDSR